MQNWCTFPNEYLSVIIPRKLNPYVFGFPLNSIKNAQVDGQLLGKAQSDPPNYSEMKQQKNVCPELVPILKGWLQLSREWDVIYVA